MAIIPMGGKLKYLSEDMQYYAMKFDVVGWRTKHNTKYIGFVNDKSVTPDYHDGAIVRGASGPEESFGWQDLVKVSKYQKYSRVYGDEITLAKDRINEVRLSINLMDIWKPSRIECYEADFCMNGEELIK